MSPEAHKTARTAIWVVGGLMGLGLVGGLVAVGLVAEMGSSVMNNANQPLPAPGVQGLPRHQINPQLGG